MIPDGDVNPSGPARIKYDNCWTLNALNSWLLRRKSHISGVPESQIALMEGFGG
tara:strand:- start:476 stop:637 length:162 start_codon:yes stop_codon:yes gene_type:complete